LIVPWLKPLYDYGWFVGFGASAVIHYVLMKAMPPRQEAVLETEAMQRGA
jgi:cytosine/uracil/thiamine/allantoin permease